MGTTKNMQFLRTSNRAAIIKALALGEASNRVELSSHLGLSKMAISGLINDLVAEDVYKRHSQPLPVLPGTNVWYWDRLYACLLYTSSICFCILF